MRQKPKSLWSSISSKFCQGSFLHFNCKPLLLDGSTNPLVKVNCPAIPIEYYPHHTNTVLGSSDLHTYMIKSRLIQLMNTVD